MKLRKYNYTLILLNVLLASGCGVYSFTGASISPDVKTISIQTFYNNAPLGPSNMSVLFTERIKDYFQQNTSLELVDSNGDLQIDGFISDYTITPVAATSSGQDDGIDFSALSRITITINSSYINLKDPTFDFDKNFSFFLDYDNDDDLASIEEGLVEEIFDQIILDIFNASVANW
ncbi:MAG: LPS assembly lipoprotein LptE [Bacteroidota bacterium]